MYCGEAKDGGAGRLIGPAEAVTCCQIAKTVLRYSFANAVRVVHQAVVFSTLVYSLLFICACWTLSKLPACSVSWFSSSLLTNARENAKQSEF